MNLKVYYINSAEVMYEELQHVDDSSPTEIVITSHDNKSRTVILKRHVESYTIYKEGV